MSRYLLKKVNRFSRITMAQERALQLYKTQRQQTWPLP